MSWSRRSVLLGLAAAGCGFTPVYGPGGVRRQGLFSLRGPQTEDGYALLDRLETRLGAPNAPQYQLQVNVSVGQSEVINDAARAIARDHLTGTITWTLRKGGTTLASGADERFVSVGKRGTFISNDAAYRDARERLLDTLIDAMMPQIWAALS